MYVCMNVCMYVCVFSLLLCVYKCALHIFTIKLLGAFLTVELIVRASDGILQDWAG